jgi:phosphonate transport system substrate-binding protein
MTNQPRSRAAAILALVLLAVTAPARADLTLGVHPFKPPSKLVEAFRPLADYLSERIGEPVSIRIAKDYQAHIDAVGRDGIDIAYVGPVPYVKLREAYGERPLLVRQQMGASPTFHSKIFVRKDSAIGALADLKGKRFAFGEPHSTMSYLVPRYMLWQAGFDAGQFAGQKFVGDHVNVALSVLSGDFDAGAVKEDVFYQYEGRGLRAIATSDPLSDHLFVASRKLAEPMVRRLREALLQLDRDPRGAAILQAMTPGVTSLVPVQDRDYDNLRGMLAKLQELGIHR